MFLSELLNGCGLLEVELGLLWNADTFVSDNLQLKEFFGVE